MCAADSQVAILLNIATMFGSEMMATSSCPRSGLCQLAAARRRARRRDCLSLSDHVGALRCKQHQSRPGNEGRPWIAVGIAATTVFPRPGRREAIGSEVVAVCRWISGTLRRFVCFGRPLPESPNVVGCCIFVKLVSVGSGAEGGAPLPVVAATRVAFARKERMMGLKHHD